MFQNCLRCISELACKEFADQVADSAEQEGSTSYTSCVGSPIVIWVPSVHGGKGTRVGDTMRGMEGRVAPEGVRAVIIDVKA
jgi:hypothetical protein